MAGFDDFPLVSEAPATAATAATATDPWAAFPEVASAAPAKPVAYYDRRGSVLADQAARRAAAGSRDASDLRPSSNDVSADPFAGEDYDATLSRVPQHFASGVISGVAAIPQGMEVLNRDRIRTAERSVDPTKKALLEEKDGLTEIITKFGASARAGDRTAKLRLQAAQDRLNVVNAGLGMAGNIEDQAGVADRTPIDQTAGYRASQAIRSAGASVIGSPDYRDQSMTGKVASGVGGAVGFVAAAIPGMIAGPGGVMSLGAAEGAAGTAGGIYEDAIQNGASEEEALQASEWGVPIGVLSALPVLKGMGQIGGAIGEKVASTLAKKLGKIAFDSGEAAATFAGSTALQNLVAKGYYDPKRGFMDGVPESVLTGVVTAGLPSAYHEARSGGAHASAGSIDKSKLNTGPVPDDAAAALKPDAQTAPPVEATAAIPPDAQVAVAPNAAPKSDADITREALASLGARAPEQAPTPVTSEGKTPAAEAAPAAPAAPEPAPAPEAAPGPAASGDTLPTVPESPATIEEQTKALLDPRNPRKAVYIPYDNTDATAPAGGNRIKSMALDGGMLYYDSKAIGAKSINVLLKNGRLGQVLGLGDITKADASKSMAKGNAPVAVTERTPEGTEVKAAAGTTETAPEQLASLEASKTPGNEVAVEPAAQVLQDRVAGREAAAGAPTENPLPEEPTPVAKSVQDQVAETKALKRAELEAKKAADKAAKEEEIAKATNYQKINPTTLAPEEQARIIGLVGKPKFEPVVLPAAKEEPSAAAKEEPAAAAKVKAISKARSKPKKVQLSPEQKAAAREEAIAKADKGEFASVEEEARARSSADTHDKERDEGRVQNAIKSDVLMKESAPTEKVHLGKLLDVNAQYERLKKILEEANKRGIGAIGRIGDSHSNSQLWLTQVRTMASKLRTLHEHSAEVQKEIVDELRTFLADEFVLASTGDGSGMRETRRNMGDMLSKQLPSEKGIEADTSVGDTLSHYTESDDAPSETLSEEDRVASDHSESLSASEDVPDAPEERKFKPTMPEGDEPIPRPVAKEGEVFKAEDAVPTVVPKKVEVIKSRKVTPPGKLTAEQLRAKLLKMTPEERETLRRDGPALDDELAQDDRTDFADELRAVGKTSGKPLKVKYATDEADETLEGRDYIDEFVPPEAILAEDAGEVWDVQQLHDQLTDNAAFNLMAPDWRTTPRQKALLKAMFPAVMKALTEKVGKVRVYILKPEDFDLFRPNAKGYYSPKGDYIVLRGDAEGERANPALMAHALAHEMTHAAFWHAIQSSRVLRARIEGLMKMAHAAAVREGYKVSGGKSQAYGFKNAHEFIAEAWSNPSFIEFLSGVKIGTKVIDWFREPDGSYAFKPSTIMEGLKGIVADWISGFPGLRIKSAEGGASGPKTLHDLAMDMSSHLMDISQVSRDHFFKRMADGTKLTGEFSLPEMARDDKRDISPEGELVLRGLSRQQAKNAAEVVKDVLGDKVTDAHYDAIAEAFKTPIGSDTQLEGAGLPPEVTKAAAEAFEPTNKDAHATPMRRLMLSLETLDYLVRRHGSAFKDGGTALRAYLSATFRAAPIAKKVADIHDRDAAEWFDMRNKDPKAAAAAASLVGDMSPFDLDVRPGATNGHLSKNGKGDYQAKAQLAGLKAQFAALPKHVQDLLSRMSDHYRATHNALAKEVTEKLVGLIKTPLTAAQKSDIVQRAMEGKLDDVDRQLVKDDTIFDALDNAREIRTRHGMFFPAQRFGDWVVTTKRKIALPDFKEVVTKQSGTRVPVKVEQEGNKVRLIVDSSVRGSHPALLREAKAYVENHDLTMTSYRLKYKDKTTGKIVNSKNDQIVGHDYDLVHEIAFQDDGVHFFDKQDDAVKFHDAAKADLASGVISDLSKVGERHEHGQLGKIMNTTAMDAVMRALDARVEDKQISKDQAKQMKTILQDAVLTNMPGNRYEKRLLKRRDILGQSDDLGRSADAYGRAAGNYMASIKTADGRRLALEELRKQSHDGIPSQVINELERREQVTGGPVKNNQIAADVMSVGAWDKLFSPAGWTVDSMQVGMNTLPVLAGSHGPAAAAGAILSAYSRIGTIDTLRRGISNTVEAFTSAGKHVLDTSALASSVRRNLGPAYHNLIDAMIAEGDIADDAGIENAAAMSSRTSTVGKAIAKLDRITRQMPNAVEMINRTVTAVAAYDLGIKKGMSEDEAVAYAIDRVRLTQGRYDAANAPVWMRKGGVLKFALVFKKYAQLQYQLAGDMIYRSFKGASKSEKMEAMKQLTALMGVNVLVGGVLGVPGSELVKNAVVALQAIGLTDYGWDDVEMAYRHLVQEATGKDLEQVINKGLLSKALGIDFTSRAGWQDLVTGFAPKDDSPEERVKFVGNTFMGAPGGYLNDVVAGMGSISDAVMGNKPFWPALGTAAQKMVPVKILADSVKAMQGLDSGKLSPLDAAKQIVGFRSLRQSDIGDGIGVKIRAAGLKKKEASSLISAYISALTPGDIAAAKRAIQLYNLKVPKGGRPISVKGLEKLRLENAKMYAE